MAKQSVLLVTGGTGSIGSEVARQALASGWAVVIQGRTESSVNTLLSALRGSDLEAPVAGVVADINKKGSVEDFVVAAGRVFGRIDAVADCLVIGPSEGGITGPFEKTDPEMYLPFVALSLVYLERLAQAVLPWLKSSDGCLLTFVSDAGVFPAPRQAIIGAARAGAIGFVKNLATEVARDGVRVHAISPSFVADTRVAEKLKAAAPDRFEAAARRAGLGLPTPKDIAPLVVFLCGAGAKKMTGQIISINGGLNV